jgi:hypothetical protein
LTENILFDFSLDYYRVVSVVCSKHYNSFLNVFQKFELKIIFSPHFETLFSDNIVIHYNTYEIQHCAWTSSEYLICVRIRCGRPCAFTPPSLVGAVNALASNTAIWQRARSMLRSTRASDSFQRAEFVLFD